MKNIQIGKIPGRSVMYLLICIVVLVIFYFAALYPYQRSLGSIDEKTARVVNLIEKQKTLITLYEKMVKRGESKIRWGLPLPDMKKLSRRDIDAVVPLLKKMAEGGGMQVMSINPDVLTLTEESKGIMIKIHLRGRFFDFRKFLLELGGMSSLERVEEIEITQGAGYKQFYLKVRLATV